MSGCAVKRNNFLFPVLILVITLLVMTGFILRTAVVYKPTITEKSFPFSFEYSYNGEVQKVEDTVICKFVAADAALTDSIFFWDHEIESGIRNHIILKNEHGTLGIATNHYAGYLMGDPEAADHYEQDGEYAPYAYFIDAQGVEISDPDQIRAMGLEVLNFDYPEPIENSTVFSHFQNLYGDQTFPLVLIALTALGFCVLLIKKPDDVTYTSADRLSTILNFVIFFLVLPVMTIVCALGDMNGGGDGLSYQIGYALPPVSVLFLAASVVLRRRGFPRSGFAVQFVGPAAFAVLLVIDAIESFIC